MTEDGKTRIPGRLTSAAVDRTVAGADIKTTIININLANVNMRRRLLLRMAGHTYTDKYLRVRPSGVQWVDVEQPVTFNVECNENWTVQ